jgi:prepilin-type N-terminal cleavage/methylation domain-containing protein
MGRREGFTLVETLLAIVIVSVLSLAAFPKVRSSLIKSDLRGARTRVANMLSAARATAAQGNRNSWVEFNGNVAVVTASPRWKAPVGANTKDTVGNPVNLNTVYGATVSLNNGISQLRYDPRGWVNGFGAGSNATILLTRSGYKDSVKVDALGRIVK